MHTNKTQYFELPQFIASDKGNWLDDLNPGFLAIDTAMHTNDVNAKDAQSTAQSAISTAASADSKASSALTTANNMLINVPVQFTAVPASKIKNVKLNVFKNANNSLINIYGEIEIDTTELIPAGTSLSLGTLSGINPSAERQIYAGCYLLFSTRSGIASLVVSTSGVISLVSGGVIPVANYGYGYVQGIFNTANWYA